MLQNSPETWLQSELSDLLVTIHDALDAWARLPFEASWTRKPAAEHYWLMLKGMEEQLLRMWVRMERKQWNTLESEVIAWNGSQKRMPNGVLRNYYSCLQALSLNDMEEKHDKKTFPRTWSGFLVQNICFEPYLLKRFVELKENVVSEELENLCKNFLQCMQVFHHVQPRELCSNFYTILSPFTGESYFLTDYPSLPSRKSSLKKINSFAQELLSNKDWHIKTTKLIQELKKNS